MTLRGRLRTELRRLWKRHVTGQPDRYQACVSFPATRPDAADARFATHLDALERVFEGWIDVYARPSRIVIVSDPVPADHFDLEQFQTVLDDIETAYADSHALATVTKWRSIDGDLVESFVAVPVRPLFASESDSDGRAREGITPS